MKQQLAQWFRRLADMLDPPAVSQPDLPPAVDISFVRASAIVKEMDVLYGQYRGNFRRRRAFDLLKKEFPLLPDRKINFLIEAVLDK